MDGPTDQQTDTPSYRVAFATKNFRFSETQLWILSLLSRVLLSTQVTPRFSDKGLSFGNPKAPSVPFVPGLMETAGQNILSEYQTHKKGEEKELEEGIKDVRGKREREKREKREIK